MSMDTIKRKQKELQDLWARERILIQEIKGLWLIQLDRTNGATDAKDESMSPCLRQPDVQAATIQRSVGY